LGGGRVVEKPRKRRDSGLRHDLFVGLEANATEGTLALEALAKGGRCTISSDPKKAEGSPRRLRVLKKSGGRGRKVLTAVGNVVGEYTWSL